MEVEGTPVKLLKRGETYKYYGASKKVQKAKYLKPIENAYSGKKWYLFKLLVPRCSEVLLSRKEVLSLIRQL